MQLFRLVGDNMARQQTVTLSIVSYPWIYATGEKRLGETRTKLWRNSDFCALSSAVVRPARPLSYPCARPSGG